MRVLALVAALLLLPAAQAMSPFSPDEVMRDPISWAEEHAPDSVVDPAEEAIPPGTVLSKEMCIRSESSVFCTDGLGPEPDVRQDNESFDAPPVAEPAEEPVAATGEEAPVKASGLPFERTVDPETPEPPAPAALEPASPAPSTDGLAPAPVPSRASAMDWAVLTAAVALPWAIGLKLLATLLAMRRVGRDSPTLRGAVLEAVAREPGIRHTDLVARIGKGNGTVEHHVAVLLRSGDIQRVRLSGATFYYAGRRPLGPEDHHRMALRSETARRVVDALGAAPGLSLAELAQRVGIAISTAHHHVARLAAAGLVQDARDGGRRRLSLAASVDPCCPPVSASPGLPLASMASPASSPSPS